MDSTAAIAKQGRNNVFLDFREVNSTIGVMNAHDISVILSMPKNIPVRSFSENKMCADNVEAREIVVKFEKTIVEGDKITTEVKTYNIPFDPCANLTVLASKMEGFVGVNTYDKVDVLVSFPQSDVLNANTYKAALLHKTINDYMAQTGGVLDLTTNSH